MVWNKHYLAFLVLLGLSFVSSAQRTAYLTNSIFNGDTREFVGNANFATRNLFADANMIDSTKVIIKRDSISFFKLRNKIRFELLGASLDGVSINYERGLFKMSPKINFLLGIGVGIPYARNNFKYTLNFVLIGRAKIQFILSRRSALNGGLGLSQFLDTEGVRKIGYSYYYPTIGYDFCFNKNFAIGADVYCILYLTKATQIASDGNFAPWVGLNLLYQF
jgi:hypothetical protein